MGFKRLQLKIKTDYNDQELRVELKKKSGLNKFSFSIEKKSLDARNKSFPHWLITALISSKDILENDKNEIPELLIPYRKRNKKIIVIGSGPAGFFSAYVLQQAGFDTTILERGSNVKIRTKEIAKLEKKSEFSEANNYAFGEGGAGTFSDGKLTSRSKHIKAERNFILKEYVKAGAPEEILYMAHPHVGTDNLKKVVANLRKKYEEIGGKIHFDTKLLDITSSNGKIKSAITNNAELETDYLILATGHSAYDTYRMLIERGVQFDTKRFAIGHRIEHHRTLINKGLWGKENLPGVKAAEYRMTSKTSNGLSVFTFCMCPGGKVVPAAAFPEKSVVNGMSYYKRNGEFSNAGYVVGVHPDELMGTKASPLEILDWMDKFEESFYRFSNSYIVPASKAKDYLQRKESSSLSKSSYPLGIASAPLYDLIPDFVSNAIIEAMPEFNRKIKGFNQGTFMGLESKTSSPIQVLRDKNRKCIGFENLFFVGEGSGYSGGIISSAADGVKLALDLSKE